MKINWNRVKDVFYGILIAFVIILFVEYICLNPIDKEDIAVTKCKAECAKYNLGYNSVEKVFMSYSCYCFKDSVPLQVPLK